MDHDRLFKQLLTTFFVEFIELFLPKLAAHLNRDSIEFLDKEVFTDLTGGERHEVDLLARARLADTDAFFLIHVENQATRQPEFGQRMFRYFARLHEKYGLPVIPLRCCPTISRDCASRITRSALIRDFMMSYLRLTREEEVVYNHQLTALEPTEKRPIVELMDVFTARRIRNGITLQLEHRFGALPSQTREGIENLPAENLEDMLVALLDFKEIADADVWMAEHPG